MRSLHGSGFIPNFVKDLIMLLMCAGCGRSTWVARGDGTPGSERRARRKGVQRRERREGTWGREGIERERRRRCRSHTKCLHFSFVISCHFVIGEICTLWQEPFNMLPWQHSVAKVTIYINFPGQEIPVFLHMHKTTAPPLPQERAIIPQSSYQTYIRNVRVPSDFACHLGLPCFRGM